MYAYTYIYIYVHVYMYIYTYMHICTSVVQMQNGVQITKLHYGGSGFLRATHNFAKILEIGFNFAS